MADRDLKDDRKRSWCGMELPDYAYCDVCEAITRTKAESLIRPDKSGWYLGGDLACSACGYTIATLYERAPRNAAAETSIN